MPALLLRLLPRSLVGRVFALFACSMLVFVGVGLGMFYRHQYLQHIEDTQDAAHTLVEVAERTVSDSAVIGDYDTVKRTLATMLIKSPFRSAAYIDVKGGAIRVDAQPDLTLVPAPHWLVAHVAGELYDVNRVVAVGGTDYGVLRLHFDEGRLAAQLWQLMVQSASLAALMLGLSLTAARALLARWLQNLGLLRFEEDAAAPINADTPLEIREAIQAVNRGAASMRDAYGQRIASLMHSLVQHTSALDQAAIVSEVDRDGILTAVNDRFVRESGRARPDLVGQPLNQAGGGWAPTDKVWTGEVAVPGEEGERQWYRTIVPIFDDARRLDKYICIDFDISERKESESAIVRNATRQGLVARLGRKALEAGPLEELFEKAAKLACDGIGTPYAAFFAFDREAGTASLQAAHGFPAVFSADTRALPFACPAARDAREILARWPTGLLGFEQAGSSIDANVVCHGQPFGVLAVYGPEARVFQEDDESFLDSLCNILATAVEREQSRSRLTWLAQYDTLTGLPNRHRLGICLEDAIRAADAQQRRAGVMFIDLDRFKNVNDMLGHSVGDQLLAEAGARLSDCVRERDVVARLGGDEFAVVLPQLHEAGEMDEIARRIVHALAQPFLLQGQQLFVSASVGIAAYPDDGRDAATLLKSADTAMYGAKQSGRNNYQFYLPEMNANAALRLQTEHQLHLALEKGEFELHFQPKVRLSTGAVSGFEALLRWRHPERGLIAPAEFMAILEETGMILPVGEWVIAEACRQLGVWSALYPTVPPIAINLSARQLGEASLPATIRAIVAAAGVSPSLLEFELTESMLMEDPEAAVRILTDLKRQGMRLSVDDFGTGYSSLAYLKRFPLDALKIDRTFVRDLPGDSDDAAITKAVISLAHSLNLKVVAEGVENAAHLDALQAYGCDEIQGYYIGKPVPAAQCEAMLMSEPLVAA